MKIVFLDFTGTIDILSPLDLEPIEVGSAVFEPIPQKPKKASKSTALKPTKRMSIGEMFYEHVGEFFDFSGDEFMGDHGTSHGFYSIKDEPNKECIKYLKQLLDNTGAKLVYSSTRRVSGWKDCADYVGLPLKYSLGHPIFGVTPEIEHNWKSNDFTTLGYKERQKEIKAWFDQWKGEPVENYVILDDDPIVDFEMKKHWVPSIQQNGFMKNEYKEALKILTGV